jgi:hypothetical protein
MEVEEPLALEAARSYQAVELQVPWLPWSMAGFFWVKLGYYRYGKAMVSIIVMVNRC